MFWWETDCIWRHLSSRKWNAWAFILKENQRELLREADRLTRKSPTGIHTEPDLELQYWQLPEVDWPFASRLVRIAKTVRTVNIRHVIVTEKDWHRIKSKKRGQKRIPTFTPLISFPV